MAGAAVALLVAGDGVVFRARMSVSGQPVCFCLGLRACSPLLPAAGVSGVGLRGGTETFAPRSAQRPRPRQRADRGPARGFPFSGPPQPPPPPPGAAPHLGSCEAVSLETRPHAAVLLGGPRPAHTRVHPPALVLRAAVWGRSVCFLICESSRSSSWAAFTT